MKKKEWPVNIIAVFLVPLVAWASIAFAAAANDDDCDERMEWKNRPTRTLYLDCTTDSGDGSLDYTIDDSKGMIDGWYGYTVTHYAGTVSAKRAADMEFTNSIGLDYLGTTNNGLDMIYSTTPQTRYFEKQGDGADFYPQFKESYPPQLILYNSTVPSAKLHFIIDLDD